MTPLIDLRGPAAALYRANINTDIADFGAGITVIGSGSAVFQVGANVGNTMNVAFNDVIADLGRVAGTQLVGHAEFFARGRDVIDFVRLDLEAVLLHVGYPLPAAITGGAFVNINRGGGLRPNGSRSQQGDESE